MPAPGPDEVVGSPEAPLSVAAVAAGVSGRIRQIPRLWITGEVVSLSRTGGGVFLTLADPDPPDPRRPPTLTARAEAALVDALAVPLRTGDQVLVFVRLAYWPTKGQVAAQVADLRPAGEGALLERIELLRLALRGEGLFDQARKRLPPPLPRVIGLVTGAGTHAESDVVTRTRERWPDAVFRTIHTPVQGSGCAPAVAAAVRALDADPQVEVIVIARGGGSSTDLAPFSDEGLIRAVAACRTPVVSAIGHEPDHPILDDVADLRAGTPTQAAALIVLDVVGELRDLDRLRQRAGAAVRRRLATETATLAAVASRPVLAVPTTVPDGHARDLAQVATRLRTRARTAVTLAAASLDSTAAALTALSPRATLARGYAVVRRADGRALGPVADIRSGTGLDIRLVDGHLPAATTGPGTLDPGLATLDPGPTAADHDPQEAP